MFFHTFNILALLCILAIAVCAHRDNGNGDDSRGSFHEEHKCEHEKHCHEIKRHCRDYNGPRNCYRPKIIYAKDKHGCHTAVIRCRGSGTKSLVTSHDVTLFIGEGTDKLVTCKKDRWHASDIYGDSTRFNTVFCLDDNIQIYPQPSYVPNNPPQSNYPPSGPY